MLVDNPQPITHKELLTLAKFAKGNIKCIYLHWTAGHYHQAYDDYHFNIAADGTVYKTCIDLRQFKSTPGGAIPAVLALPCAAV